MSTNTGFVVESSVVTVLDTLLHVTRYLANSIPSGHDSSRPLCALLPELESVVDMARNLMQDVAQDAAQNISEKANAGAAQVDAIGMPIDVPAAPIPIATTSPIVSTAAPIGPADSQSSTKFTSPAPVSPSTR